MEQELVSYFPDYYYLSDLEKRKVTKSNMAKVEIARY